MASARAIISAQFLRTEHLADPTTKPFGIGTMLHETRTDFSMLLGLIFLIVSGGGRWSLEARRRH